jgi:hypothetical protein
MNGATMTTTTLHPVDDFARAVRTALADLPADEVDDLTDGLESDFGDPAADAHELRSAAGLPYRRPASTLTQVLVLLKNWRHAIDDTSRSNRAIAGLLSFVISLRPVGWIYRGWTIFLWFEFGLGAGIHALPITISGALVFVPAIILSVQFGRGRWMPWTWLRIALTMANIALVVATPWVAAWAINSSAWYY